MFESAEIGHKIGKAAYREAVPLLRAALLEAQVDLYADKKIPVLVLVLEADPRAAWQTSLTNAIWRAGRGGCLFK